jgi:hypothetical protein
MSTNRKIPNFDFVHGTFYEYYNKYTENQTVFEFKQNFFNIEEKVNKIVFHSIVEDYADHEAYTVYLSQIRSIQVEHNINKNQEIKTFVVFEITDGRVFNLMSTQSKIVDYINLVYANTKKNGCSLYERLVYHNISLVDVYDNIINPKAVYSNLFKVDKLKPYEELTIDNFGIANEVQKRKELDLADEEHFNKVQNSLSQEEKNISERELAEMWQ